MSKRKWTEESVVRRLQQLHSDNKDLSARNVYLTEGGLHKAASKLFGNYENAVRAAGFEYETIRRLHKRYDRASVATELKRLQRERIDVSPTFLRKHYPGLYAAGRRFFGSTMEVYKAAGISQDDSFRYKEKGYWSRERVIDEIKRLEREKHRLDIAGLRNQIGKKRMGMLVHESSRHFGGWYPALEAAGVNSSRWRKLRPSGYWTKETVIHEIRDMYSNNEDLSYLAVRKRRQSALETAATKIFGGWYAALVAAEIPEDVVRALRRKSPLGREFKPSGYWNSPTIIREIRQLQAGGVDLSDLAAKIEVPHLHSVACKNFGSWYSALEAAGIDPDLHRRQASKNYWTKKLILSKLRDYVKENKTLDLMNDRDPRLYRAAIKRFGGLRAALTEAGLDSEQLLSRTSWSEERIVTNIRQLVEMEESLSSTTVQNGHSALHGAAIRYYGSWENAVRAAGFDYDQIRRDWLFESFRGMEFEKCVRETLRLLNWKVDYQRRFRYDGKTVMPDFVDKSSGTWIDAKLDAGGYSVHLTIQKYLPCAKKVMIIYLKGRPRKRDIRSAEFVPVSNLYPELRELGANDLVARIDMLKHNILRPEYQQRFHEFIQRKSRGDKKSIAEIMEYADGTGD